jgi:signal transduction histidine kinase
MTDKLKEQIDKMSYISMLNKWRFASIGDPLFQGETGDYFKKVMAEKRSKIDDNKLSTFSKNLGW